MTDQGPSSAQNILETLSEGLAGLVEAAAASVVRVQARPGVAGTGFVWQPEGLILTADHVVQEEEMTVGLPEDRSLPATLVGRDQRTDLALLRVNASGLPALLLAEEDAPRPGALVLAVGRPGFGGPIASMGIVSAVGLLGRGWRRGSGEEAIYSNVVLYPGFSGGPLLDARGRVLGMNTSTFGRGASVAIPISLIRRVTGHLLAAGRVRRGYLGITTQPVRLPARLVQGLGLDQETALLILAVELDSPADRAGLALGDVLLGVGGHAVRSPEDLLRALGPELVGARAALRVVRGGQVREVTASVGERPAG
ncbi:MAG: trypsin-like peptidase domain-containing protein [Chloroflexi bacterium]|nr:trypsin-like peptidase domain-containing protein [Chloroflexota bacterium]